ncbi:class I adenylate-forming enzyme family protein [Rhizobium helianthi]|uniref:Class I adenylate-forming enzyme family protein n=1 Tax=Rhizobium helianthi TaxID=1132695 RepID=A0ABW4M2W4_9HYPH
MRLETSLFAQAMQRPDKLALVADGQRLSYAQLAHRVRRLAAGFEAHGIQPGDRVLILLDNGIDAVCCFFALWAVGAIPCPLHPTVKAEKLGQIAASTEPFAIIGLARQREAMQAARQTAGLRCALIVAGGQERPPGTLLDLNELLSDDVHDEAVGGRKESELALVIHTSGSTGTPKGVMLTHANVDFTCRAIVDYLGNSCEDVILSVLPLSFGYGMTQMVTAFMVGATLVLEKSFAYPRVILKTLGEEKVTGLPLVPAMAGMLTGMSDLQPGFLPHLRYVTSAAAALPPAVADRLQSLLPSAKLFIMYGQTECIRATYLDPAERAARPLSVGKPLPGTGADILDEAGNPLPAGAVGELALRGPHVMVGYWQQEALTAGALETTADGPRYRTGDLFRADQDGFLYFIARKDDIIKTRGEKVSPQEVERVLHAHDGVLEAAVEGVDDALFGQVIKAHVVLRTGFALSPRELLRHCADHLEDYMIPKFIEFHEALPRTTSGKIRLSLLNETASAQEQVA